MASAPDTQGTTGAQLLNGDGERATLEVLDAECILMRNLLTLEEQTRLFEYIQHHDKTPSNLPRAMAPAPKTLQLGEAGSPNLRYKFGEESVVNAMVEKGAGVLQKNGLHVIDGLDVCQYKSLSMATIRYEAPDGHFPPHVDHCNESVVFLASLGCTANFMVKGPTMDAKTQFKFCSGDLLVFNASSKAAILHSVMSIDETGSEMGELLGSRFPVLRSHRYGVQCRMYFQDAS
eukprot:CAMPEP_0197926336 /NCGR_PEP_ID=MMETSP1439-20131203/98968_1 /TAXON_ID=66791 /ORGANISM="Gonyaulax spinifera, Strain CCMP409" /LENGTH=232 /DNA_ID=CAMNT_0043548865 /DNA_START=40 /DNA_END=738 /DNA_ORIENTATION=+